MQDETKLQATQSIYDRLMQKVSEITDQAEKELAELNKK